MKQGYREAVRFLESFIDYERMADFSYVRSFKLARARRLFKDCKIAAERLPVIHVAGTKGKGSTATFIAFILAGCGFKVGLYTSPHFHDFRERIAIVKARKGRVGTSFISRPALCRLIKEIAPAAERLRAHRRLGHVSFFEVYTALALKYFVRQHLDFAVLECGMGGRLDATNIARPLISVITHIGYDHTQYLGTRIEQIAFEKAGIIKRGRPVVSAFQERKAESVLERKTRGLKSPLYRYAKDFSTGDVRRKNGRTLFDLSWGGERYRDLAIRLKGAHQIENASLAVVACRLLKDRYGIDKPGIYEGLKQAYVKARFEAVRIRGRRFLFDIAHNPSSMAALDRALKLYFPGRPITLVFGCSSDKDIPAMLKSIDFDQAVFTRSGNPRAQDPAVIKERAGVEGCCIEDVKKAVGAAERCTPKDKGIIVVTGSVFVVAEAKKVLRYEG